MGTKAEYTPEFRADTVRMVVEYSRPVQEVAEQAGVRPDTLRTWIHRAHQQGLPMTRAKPSYEQLEAENKELRSEKRTLNRELVDQRKRCRGQPFGFLWESCQLLRSGELRPGDWFEVISAVEKQNSGLSIRLMCDTAGVSPSGFRRWRDTPPAVTERHDDLAVDIEAVWRDSGCIYGSVRVHAELVRQDRARCCEHTVRRIMADKGWSSLHPTPWRCTTQSDGTPPSPDLLRRDFTAERPGVRLVGDIAVRFAL